MCKLLLLSLLFPLFASAQYPDDIAYLKSIPPGLGQSIHLPERDYNPDFKFDDSYEYRQKIRLFVVSTDSVYRAMFYRYIFTKDSISNYAKAQKTYTWLVLWKGTCVIHCLLSIFQRKIWSCIQLVQNV